MLQFVPGASHYLERLYRRQNVAKIRVIVSDYHSRTSTWASGTESSRVGGSHCLDVFSQLESRFNAWAPASSWALVAFGEPQQQVACVAPVAASGTTATQGGVEQTESARRRRQHTYNGQNDTMPLHAMSHTSHRAATT